MNYELRTMNHELIKVFLNSLFIQAAWSFTGMQNLGFASSVAPALKRLYRGKELEGALRRHMEFFNTHPYMAAPILGAVVRLEEEVKAGKRDIASVSSFKRGVMGPYGALGDSLFWSSIRPFAAVAGVIMALSGSLWAPVIFLIAFNMPHLWIRFYGLLAGYRLGEDIVVYIKSLDLPGWGRRVRGLALLLVGVLLALYWWRIGVEYQISRLKVQTWHFGFDIWHFTLAFVLLGIVLFIAWLLRKGFSSSAMVYLSLIFALIMGIFR